MPKVPIDDPKHWRERAEEARTVGDQLTNPDAKRRMLRIADDWQQQADIERRGPQQKQQPPTTEGRGPQQKQQPKATEGRGTQQKQGG